MRMNSENTLVEPTLDLVRKVLRPNSRQRPQSSRSLHVSNHTDYDHRRSLNNSDSLNNLSLVHFRETSVPVLPWRKEARGHTGSGSVQISHNVGHPCFVPHNSGEVDGLLGVVLTDQQIIPRGRIPILTLGKALTFPRCLAARFLGTESSAQGAG